MFAVDRTIHGLSSAGSLRGSYVKPDKLNAYNLFEHSRRYLIPLYQRPYVWERDSDLVPLWEDIRGRAEAALERMNRTVQRVQPHFLGAIVTRSIPVFGLETQSLDVIDGQQRLTTLQLFLAAVRDILAAEEVLDLVNEFNRLTENSGTVANEIERLKVWPTNSDREAFNTVMNARSANQVKAFRDSQRKKWKGTNRIAEAYLYFHEAVQVWLYDTDKERPSSGDNPRERGIALFEALRNHLQIIVIGLEEDDDPQAIFETLNARGQPLLASDLVRNFVFTQANSRGEDADRLYEEYWREFDDVGSAPFWRERVQFGREKRERVVLFLFHFLASRLAIDFGAANIYDTFKRWWVSNDGPESVEQGLQTLKLYADAYRRIVVPEDGTRYGMFLHRLGTLETTSFHPTLLHLMVGRDLPEEDLDLIGAYLESYLVRRLVAGLTTKNLNRVALALLQRLKVVPQVGPDTVAHSLSEGDGDSVRWPDDTEFQSAWLSRPVYRRLRRAVTSGILRALDLEATDRYKEIVHIEGPLSIEHIMPREWRKTWTAPSPELATSEETAEERRDRLLHTFGNLTVLTQALNTKLSNSAYQKKRKAIRQSALALNDYFDEADDWDEESILSRGEELFRAATSIWPVPAGMRHQPVPQAHRYSGAGVLAAQELYETSSDDLYQLCEDVAALARLREIDRVNRVHSNPPWFSLLNIKGWPKVLHYEFRPGVNGSARPTMGVDLEGPQRLKNRLRISTALEDLASTVQLLFPGHAVVWDDTSHGVRRTLSVELDPAYLDAEAIVDGLQRLVEGTWRTLDEAVRGNR